MYEEGTPLTPDSLSKTYEDLLKLYYDGANVPEVMKYEWSFIPHFYNAFYVQGAGKQVGNCHSATSPKSFELLLSKKLRK